MRVVVFSTYQRQRLNEWCEAIRRVPVVEDVLAVGPEDAEFLRGRSRDPMHNSGELLARIRAWRPDCGVAVAAPRLPPVVHSIPLKGTLNVRLGEGTGNYPGLRELWYEVSHASAYVHWLGLDLRAIGAADRVPIFEDDTIETVGKRLEELGQLLLCDALARVARDEAPGSTHVQPEPRTRPTSVGRHIALRWRTTRARLRARLRPFTVVKLAATAAWLLIFRPLRDVMRTIMARHPVRIFTLHRVTWLCRDGMSVSPETFLQQMRYVARGHRVVNLDEAIGLVARRARLRRPVAAVTFDDGYESVGARAFPAMKSLGMVGACFVCPDIVERDARFRHDLENPMRQWLRVMKWREIQELDRNGWHVGSHTATHVRVAELTDDALLKELSSSQAAVREKIADEPMAFAYPFGGPGDVTPDAVSLARQCGYTAVLSDYGGENIPGREDDYFLLRIDIGGAHDDLMWKAMVHGLDLSRWRRLRRMIARSA